MAFAIFYELSDLSSLAGSVQVSSFPNKLKNDLRPYWQNGLSGWATAPVGQSPYEGPGSCNSCRRCVITYGTLAEFRSLLLQVATALGDDGTLESPAKYLRRLVEDMGGTAGAVEPWPVV
jgi:hypothetical protein